MATLVFTAIGNALGGPLGGAVGGLIGQQIDASLLGGRQGPRLNDLKITTSTYGSAISRHHGRVRAPGTIIWATDLVEHSDTQGGGKSGGAVTTYSYSISFAVALASRPIIEIRRVWADGNLLRGEDGDLKVSGSLRFYSGHGDNDIDPLIASAEGILAPAFRGTAYAVFEDLDLGTFGNRIPALSFEIIADDGALSLTSMLEQASTEVQTAVTLPRIAGFSDDGGTLAATLSTIDSVYPLALDGAGTKLVLRPADDVTDAAVELPEPAAADDEQSFGPNTGRHTKRQASERDIPSAMRYYDLNRDYLTGLQRADGRARPGRERTIDFPGVLSADDARALASASAQRASSTRETLAWRMAELDPQISPGTVVRIPGQSGNWRVTAWEWRDKGVELELLRLPFGPAAQPLADAGVARTASDKPLGQTVVQAFELPWSGSGSENGREVFVAASSPATGWTGASIFLTDGAQLLPLGSVRRRAVLGETMNVVPPSPAFLLEQQSAVEVALVAPDLALLSATAEELAKGANRALIGTEVVQFATAVPLGEGRWQLSGLLRGRGGTEGAANAGHPAGASFVLLDGSPVQLDTAAIPAGAFTLAASGLADATPVYASLSNAGATQKPLAPVHPRATITSGSLSLRWTRRARGSWIWRDEVDAPLVEATETYLVGAGPVGNPIFSWVVTEPSLVLASSIYTSLLSTCPGQPIWVRQTGTHAMSDPLLLHMLP